MPGWSTGIAEALVRRGGSHGLAFDQMQIQKLVYIGTAGAWPYCVGSESRGQSDKCPSQEFLLRKKAAWCGLVAAGIVLTCFITMMISSVVTLPAGAPIACSLLVAALGVLANAIWRTAAPVQRS